MLDGERLREAIERHRPDFVVPEVEAIRTEILAEMEAAGTRIVPSARAAMMTMNRDGIRELAAAKLGLRTSRYRFAESFEEAEAAAAHTGFPCVVKPVMSSSGKGQRTVEAAEGLRAAWDYAVANMRGDRARVIVEEFVRFDYEITLLTVRTRDGVLFCPPIGHRQERGDYRESWQPTPMSRARAGRGPGHGPQGGRRSRRLRPVRSRVLRQGRRGDLLRAVAAAARHRNGHPHLAEPLRVRPPRPGGDGPADPAHRPRRPAAASAVILADREADSFRYEGVAEALALGGEGAEVDVRIFGKPVTRPYRRMGVALATGATAEEARALATRAAAEVRIVYD